MEKSRTFNFQSHHLEGDSQWKQQLFNQFHYRASVKKPLHSKRLQLREKSFSRSNIPEAG
jgi:hypothetical protein